MGQQLLAGPVPLAGSLLLGPGQQLPLLLLLHLRPVLVGQFQQLRGCPPAQNLGELAGSTLSRWYRMACCHCRQVWHGHWTKRVKSFLGWMY